MVRKHNINSVYSGPIWGDGVEGIGTTIRKRLKFDELPLTAAKSVFTVFVEQIRSENSNPDSLGAGIGLTEIAKRTSSRIMYDFKPYAEGLSFFSMFVTIGGEDERRRELFRKYH